MACDGEDCTAIHRPCEEKADVDDAPVSRNYATSKARLDGLDWRAHEYLRFTSSAQFWDANYGDLWSNDGYKTCRDLSERWGIATPQARGTLMNMQPVTTKTTATFTRQGVPDEVMRQWQALGCSAWQLFPQDTCTRPEYYANAGAAAGSDLISELSVLGDEDPMAGCFSRCQASYMQNLVGPCRLAQYDSVNGTCRHYSSTALDLRVAPTCTGGACKATHAMLLQAHAADECEVLTAEAARTQVSAAAGTGT